ncbi:MAG: glycoside hydrolase family 88 protein [Spirochaetales bacterium]|nr:glycoside hydrolase family 88 protein [Spirochaetales bacterium]
MSISKDIVKDLKNIDSPETVGIRLAGLFVLQKIKAGRHYKDACAWYGALSVAGICKNHTLLEQLIGRYDAFRSGYDDLLSGEGHVDENIFGIVPLEIAIQSRDEECRREGLLLADHQYTNIRKQIRYAIDDMFMITGLQVQAWKASRNYKYLDLAAATMADYLEKLQQKDGLFFHHVDFRHKWGRGNGWVAAGMALLLSVLDHKNKYYEEIHTGFQHMMNGLLERQIAEGPGDGLWKQIIDSEDMRNWAETSGSAMFCFAMLSGLRHGQLEGDAYVNAARRAWRALVRQLDRKGKLRNISKWAYKPMSHPESGDRYDNDEENYYFERKRLTGDNHGQAPLLWAVAELLG